MQAPADKQESAESVVFNNLGWIQGENSATYSQGPDKKGRTAIEVSVSSLCAQNEESTDHTICNNGKSTEIPHQRVSNQVNLAMILDPEVLWLTELG